MALRVRTCGESAVLVEVGETADVLGLLAGLRADPIEGVTSLVPAARTLLLSYAPEKIDAETLTAELLRRPLLAPAVRTLDEVVVPVHYEGPDLADVARHCGLSEREVVARHTAGRYRVAFCGFAPGFAYLTGLDRSLYVPRRPSPRTRVPAGAVAIAAEFSAVYPRDTPGGWQLLGHTSLPVWETDREPPALLAPGTSVRFVEATLT